MMKMTKCLDSDIKDNDNDIKDNVNDIKDNDNDIKDNDKVNRCLARYSPRATTTNRPTNRALNKPAWPGPN